MLRQISSFTRYTIPTLITTMLLNISGCAIQNAKTETERWTFPQFVQAIESNEIEQVILENQLTYALDHPAMRGKFSTTDGQQVQVWLPNDDYVIKVLTENNVVFSFQPSIYNNTIFSIPELTFTQFIQAVKNNEIRSIRIKNRGFKAISTTVDYQKVQVYLPQNSHYLFDLLVKKEVVITSEAQNKYTLNNKDNWTFTQFIQAIESNHIKQITIDVNVTNAEILTVDNQQVKVDIPRNPDYILPLLMGKDILISFKPSKENFDLTTIIIKTIINSSQQQKWHSIPEITFAEFSQAVKNRQVKLFTRKKDLTQGRLTFVDGSEFKVYLPQICNYCIDILSSNTVPMRVEN